VEPGENCLEGLFCVCHAFELELAFTLIELVETYSKFLCGEHSFVAEPIANKKVAQLTEDAGF